MTDLLEPSLPTENILFGHKKAPGESEACQGSYFGVAGAVPAAAQ